MLRKVNRNIAVLMTVSFVMFVIHNTITNQLDITKNTQQSNGHPARETAVGYDSDTLDNYNDYNDIDTQYYLNAMKQKERDKELQGSLKEVRFDMNIQGEEKEVGDVMEIQSEHDAFELSDDRNLGDVKVLDDKKQIRDSTGDHVVADNDHDRKLVVSGSQEQCRAKWLGTSLMEEKDTGIYGHVTCAQLLYGNISSDEVYQRAKVFMKERKLETPDYKQMILSDGCDKFKYDQGYHTEPVNAEEAEFPIAFNILMHKDIKQLALLLRSIYRPQNSYCIHMDMKTDKDVKDALEAIVGCFDNVFIASRLERVVYAGYTRLQADINCMEDQMISPINWKYVLNIAGSEMPAKSNLQMVRILKIYNGANDVEGLTNERVIKKRFQWKWFEDSESQTDYKMKQSEIPHDNPPYNLTILRGNSCGVFSRSFIEWVLNDPVPCALLQWSVDTQSPDEQYWSTLNHMYANPHIQPPGGYVGDSMEKPWLAKYVSWGGAAPCHGRFVHSICIFGINDLPHLITRKEFTYNKFSSDFEPLAQECISRWIEYQTQCDPPFDENYYKTLPFIHR